MFTITAKNIIVEFVEEVQGSKFKVQSFRLEQPPVSTVIGSVRKFSIKQSMEILEY